MKSKWELIHETFKSGRARRVGTTSALTKLANDTGAFLVFPNELMASKIAVNNKCSLHNLEIALCGTNKKVIFDMSCFEAYGPDGMFELIKENERLTAENEQLKKINYVLDLK